MIMKTGEIDNVNVNGGEIQNEKNTVSTESQMELCYPEELKLREETVSDNEVSVVKNYYLMSPQDLLNELSKQIIAGSLNTGETVSVDSFGDRLVFNNKT
jgi:hypothetical protein